MTDHTEHPAPGAVTERTGGLLGGPTREGGQMALGGREGTECVFPLPRNDSDTPRSGDTGVTLDLLARALGMPPASLVVPRATTGFVIGTPAPQGSKKGFVHKGTGRVVMVESSKKVKPWRAEVVARFTTSSGPVAHFPNAVAVRLDFVMPRPKRLPKSRPTPPHTVRPDADKLTRSTLDALVDAGVLADDSHVVKLEVTKRYAEPDELAGCMVWICGPRTAT